MTYDDQSLKNKKIGETLPPNDFGVAPIPTMFDWKKDPSSIAISLGIVTVNS